MAILCFKEKDGTVNMLVTGKVTREPELKEGNRGNKIKFSVAYGKKKYMNIETWEDSDAAAVAQCLEKGDTVSVSGYWSQWEHNEKTYSSLTADYIGIMMPPHDVAVPVSAPKAENSQYAAGHFADLPNDDTDDETDLPF